MRAMDTLEIITAFQERVWDDVAAGCIRSLEAYLGMFPGAEAELARAWIAVLDGLSDTDDLERHERRIGPYLLKREIGRGGQGIVYEAIDSSMDGEPVALKVLVTLGAQGEQFLQRFWREVRITRQLDHPGICPVLRAEVRDGIPFIAMRLLRGQTLEQLIAAARDRARGAVQKDLETTTILDEAPFAFVATPDEGASSNLDTIRDTASDASPMHRLVTWFADAARALHAAHEQGILHRDVKPGNLMVTPEGRAVLMDFGLAREDDPGHTLTRTGEIFGTPGYLAPERVEKDRGRADARTDVWALGVCLYEALTLERPFRGPTREAIYRAILDQEPSDPRRLQPTVTRELKTIVMTALAKDRDRRYRNALAMAEDLERMRDGLAIRARDAGPLTRIDRWRRRNPTTAASLLVTLLALVAGLFTSLNFLFEARSETRRANENAAEASRLLETWRRLTDRTLLDRLNDESQDLYPAWPEMIPRMEAWVREAEGMGARLPQLEAALAELRESPQRFVIEAPAPTVDDRLLPRVRPNRRTVFRGPRAAELQVLYQDLSYLVPRIRRLLSEDAFLGLTIGSVRDRIERARLLERETLTSTAAREAWIACQARVAAARETASHPYRRLPKDFALVPQAGLLPLGPDPRTGLEEFCLIQSGTPPVRSSSGALGFEPGSGAVLVLLPGGLDTAITTQPLAPFFLGKHELTVNQYALLMNANRGVAETIEPEADRGGRLPVAGKRWSVYAALAWRLGCELPSEAQWQFAAQAGEFEPLGPRSTDRTSGDQPPLVVEETPFGAFGLHGMRSSVSEACEDPWQVVVDTRARVGRRGLFEPPLSYRPDRTMRGSSFLRPGPGAGRAMMRQALTHDDVGMRLARRIQRD